MPRRGTTAPESTQTMWGFRRHCGNPFPPEGIAVRGVRPDCAEARYGQCGACGRRVDVGAETAEAVPARRPEGRPGSGMERTAREENDAGRVLAAS